MSRTDKTRPYWVQLRDPDFPWPITERHHHHGCFGTTKECDIDFPLPVTRRQGLRPCEYWCKYSHNNKIYGRSGYRRSFRSFQDRRARGKLRELRYKWLRETDREEIDSTENAPSHRWLWRRWYWD